MEIRFKAMASAVAFLALLAPGPAALRADPADDFLVRVSVPNGRFVSFVDGDGWCSEAWKTNRLARWKARVADRIGVFDGRYAGPADVSVQDWRKPFLVQIDPRFVTTAPFLRDGDSGLEELELDGGESVRTNRFSFRSLASSLTECDVAWTPPDTAGSFKLDSAQGAGDGIWLLSWNDLEARWKARLPEEGDAVRGEIWNLMSDVRVKPGTPGAAAWKQHLDRFLDSTPSVWPGIRFENAYGEAVRVKLLLGDTEVEPARRLQAGDVWTAPVRDVPKPGRSFNWMACPVDGGLCEKDYGVHPVGEWSRRRRSPAIVPIDNGLKPLPHPVLVLDDRVFPKETLDGLSEETVRVFARYADADEGVQERLDANPLDDRLAATVAPHRPIRSFRFELSVPGLPEEVELKPARTGHYCCGETVALDGRVEWAPWPELVVRNPDDKLTVTNTIHFLDETGERVRKALRVVVEPGETKTPDPGEAVAADRPGKAALRLRVVSEAITCDPATNDVAFVRGAEKTEIAFVPPRRDFRWPAREQMKLPLASYRTWIDGMGSSKHAARPDEDWRREMRSTLFLGEEAPKVPGRQGPEIFGIVRTHLNTCRGCDKCDGFRRRNAAWLRSPGIATPNEGVFLALWNDDQIAGKAKAPAVAAESTEKARRKIGAEDIPLGYNPGEIAE